MTYFTFSEPVTRRGCVMNIRFIKDIIAPAETITRTKIFTFRERFFQKWCFLKINRMMQTTEIQNHTEEKLKNVPASVPGDAI